MLTHTSALSLLFVCVGKTAILCGFILFICSFSGMSDFVIFNFSNSAAF